MNARAKAETALVRAYPEYTELVIEEFYQWLTYGILLGLLIARGNTAALAEAEWLLAQPESGQNVARCHALRMLGHA